MKKPIMPSLVATLLILSLGNAYAIDRADTTQKGSTLLFPDIDLRRTETMIRLANDGDTGVTVQCIWIDQGGTRRAFGLALTRSQPVVFDARTGSGTVAVTPFPSGPGTLNKGALVCMAVQPGPTNGPAQQVRWNHLEGSATVYHRAQTWIYEYQAFAFQAQQGSDLDPVGVAGVLELDRTAYDPCYASLVAQFTPVNPAPGAAANGVIDNRIAVVSCTLNLAPGGAPTTTKLVFEVWNADEIKFTGMSECVTDLEEFALSEADTGGGRFLSLGSLGTTAARYRVSGINGLSCPGSVAVGLTGVKKSTVTFDWAPRRYGTTLRGEGLLRGTITWGPTGPGGQ